MDDLELVREVGHVADTAEIKELGQGLRKKIANFRLEGYSVSRGIWQERTLVRGERWYCLFPSLIILSSAGS